MWILYFVLYYILHFLSLLIFNQWFEYSSYVVDAGFIVWALSAFGKDLGKRGPGSVLQAAGIFAAFFGGGVSAFLVSQGLGLSNPFQYLDLRLIFLLLIAAPVIEEFLFRYTFWKIIQSSPRFAETRHKVSFLAWITAFIFSMAHVEGIFFVPEYRDFILYQGCYTFVVGLVLGLLKAKWARMQDLILFHFAFNLGFGCALIAKVGSSGIFAP